MSFSPGAQAQRTVVLAGHQGTLLGRQPTAGRFLDLVRKAGVGAEALDAMARQVHNRRRHPARVVMR